MIDHAPRIRAEQQQAADQSAIDDMERRSAPLQWAVLFATIALCAALAIDSLHEYVQHVTDMAATNEVFAQCLNGQTIGIGASGVLRCEVREYKLIANGGTK